MTTPRESYDIQRLIADVQQILRDNGREPHIAPGDAGNAEKGAQLLLTACGIAPVMDSVEAYRRTLDKPWPSSDRLDHEP